MVTGYSEIPDISCKNKIQWHFYYKILFSPPIIYATLN